VNIIEFECSFSGDIIHSRSPERHVCQIRGTCARYRQAVLLQTALPLQDSKQEQSITPQLCSGLNHPSSTLLQSVVNDHHLQFGEFFEANHGA
jgi:hypothetical protein